MGLYGSPDLSKKYGDTGELETKNKRVEGHRVQNSIWLWTTIIILNLLILLLVGIKADNTLTVLALDSIIVFIVSVISMIINLVKKEKVRYDLAYITFSIISFLIFVMSLAS